MQIPISTNEQLFHSLKQTKPFKLQLSNPNGLGQMELSIIKESIQSVLFNYSSLCNNQLTTIIYVTSNKDYNRLKELLGITTITEDYELQLLDEDYASISLLFPSVNAILIPKKAKRNLEKYVPKHLLKEIDPNMNIAIEKCLVFLSYLASTYYSESKWKALSSTALHDQLKNGADNTFIYKKVINALKAGTKQSGPIIEVKLNDEGLESFEVGAQSKQYRLTDTYLKAGLIEYLLQDEAIIQNRNKVFYKAVFKAQNNLITSNLIGVYQQIELPTEKEILIEGRRLSRLGCPTKKGKKLTMRNGHKDSYWKDVNSRSFVEDNLELFKFLTGRGFMIPIIGDDKSGGRVVDSFTLMPSWIRNMVKINGESIVECDYSCMHPNLASKLYNGTGEHISHQRVADYLGIEKLTAKIEHLSFFNKPFDPIIKNKGSMVNSPVFKYYEENEALMLQMLRIDKDMSEHQYKATTRKLFALEVKVMTKVIRRLNDMGIWVMYVYDALYSSYSNSECVKQVMNEVVNELGINTFVGE